MHALSFVDVGSAPSARASPLPPTAEEEEGDRQSLDLQASSRFGAPFTRKSTRTSIATTISEGTTSNEWFDASEGGEEFVLDVDERTPVDEKTEAEAQSVEGSRSSLGGLSDDDEDIIAIEFQDKDEEGLVESDPVEKAKEVARRAELPCGPVGDEGSLFAVLKKNVGKVRTSGFSMRTIVERSPTGPCKCHFPGIIQRAHNAPAKWGGAAGILRPPQASSRNK